MELTPTLDKFIGNKLVVYYGNNKRATFTILDEQFSGMNMVGIIDKITVFVEQLDTQGAVVSSNIYSPIIGIGNNEVQVTTSDSSQRGKQLTKNNMATTVVNLVE
jgi:hypothetical protein